MPYALYLITCTLSLMPFALCLVPYNLYLVTCHLYLATYNSSLLPKPLQTPNHWVEIVVAGNNKIAAA